MKKLFLILALLFVSALEVKAAVLACDASFETFQTGIKEVISGECGAAGMNLKAKSGWKTKRLKFSITGIGLGLRQTVLSGFTLYCPTARFKNLDARKFYGLKAHVAPLVAGVSVGVFANARGGLCVLTGMDFLSLGAGFSGAELEFTEK